MGAKISAMLRQAFSRFYKKKCSICLVGLENSGKTTLLSVLVNGSPAATVPTIGLNVRVVSKDRIDLKVWDIGGQREYRSEWARYAEGSDVIIFVVDAADREKLPSVKEEVRADRVVGVVGGRMSVCVRSSVRHKLTPSLLFFPSLTPLPLAFLPLSPQLHNLLSISSISSIPLLILANKIDLSPHVNERDLVEALDLEEIVRTPWIVMPVSAINVVGIDSVLEWLIGVARD